MTELRDTLINQSASGTLHVGGATHSFFVDGLTRSPRPSAVSRLCSLLLASAAISTAGIISLPTDHPRQLSFVHTWTDRRRKRKPLTLDQARAMALQMYFDTERNLRAERQAEAEFLRQLFEDEELIST